MPRGSNTLSFTETVTDPLPRRSVSTIVESALFDELEQPASTQPIATTSVKSARLTRQSCTDADAGARIEPVVTRPDTCVGSRDHDARPSRLWSEAQETRPDGVCVQSTQGGPPASGLAALLDLEVLDRDLFRGRERGGRGRRMSLYGGQVAAQALRAAGATVPAERLPHSLHGYFLRPGASTAR